MDRSRAWLILLIVGPLWGGNQLPHSLFNQLSAKALHKWRVLVHTLKIHSAAYLLVQTSLHKDREGVISLHCFLPKCRYFRHAVTFYKSPAWLPWREKHCSLLSVFQIWVPLMLHEHACCAIAFSTFPYWVLYFNLMLSWAGGFIL